MNRRRRQTVVALVVVAATLFAARPAHGSGPVVWDASFNEGPFDLVADGRGVVVTTSRASVLALDRAGHRQWRVVVDDVPLGQPAIGGDVVLIGGPRSVTALARADGTRRWQHSSTSWVTPVALAGDTALTGDDSGTLAAFDAHTGAARWSAQYPGELRSPLRIARAAAAVVAIWHQSDTPAVRVFDLATGALRWEAPTGAYTAAPVVRRGVVVLAICDGDRHARVEARDLATGEVRWQTRVPASFEAEIEPAADDHEVAVVDHFGVVSLLDLITGRLRWQHDVAHALIETRVALTPDRVAFVSFSGDLFVLDRRTGRLLARMGPRHLGGYPASTIHAPGRDPNRLLVALRMLSWKVQLRRLP
jgi:outer membrane protein assembly factor BamB